MNTDDLRAARTVLHNDTLFSNAVRLFDPEIIISHFNQNITRILNYDSAVLYPDPKKSNSMRVYLESEYHRNIVFVFSNSLFDLFYYFLMADYEQFN